MLRARGPASGSDVDLPPGATVAALYDLLQIEPAHRKVLSAFVNEKRAGLGQVLQAGDRVFLGLPIGGG